MRIPNVLHITLRSDRTGGPIYVRELLRATKGDVDNYVFSPNDGELYLEFADIIGLDHLRIAPNRKFSFLALIGLIKYIHKKEIHIIHSHGKGGGIYSRLAGLLSGVPVVHTYHGIHIAGYSRIALYLYSLYERAMATLTDKFIAVVESERSAAVQLGFGTPQKIMVIRTGLTVRNDEKFLERLRDGDDASSPLRLLNYNRFDMQKNFDAILSIAYLLKYEMEAGNSVKFVVAGTGNEEARYKSLISDYEIEEYFEFVGVVRDTRSLLRECDALISTARWEGLPLAVLDAGLDSRYMILSDIPGHRELVQDKNAGLLFDAASPNELIRVCKFLQVRGALRKQSASGAKWLRDEFSYSKMANDHIKLYFDLYRHKYKRKARS